MAARAEATAASPLLGLGDPNFDLLKTMTAQMLVVAERYDAGGVDSSPIRRGPNPEQRGNARPRHYVLCEILEGAGARIGAVSTPLCVRILLHLLTSVVGTGPTKLRGAAKQSVFLKVLQTTSAVNAALIRGCW